ncbi:MAG: hypothetical protein ACXVZV_03700 [Terriglobales bacterium]
MAARTVNLYKYVPTDDGWKYFKVAFHRGNVVVFGQAETIDRAIRDQTHDRSDAGYE